MPNDTHYAHDQSTWSGSAPRWPGDAELLANALGKPKRMAGQWMALCPAHPDHNPSLSIRDAPGGKVLLRCRVGCSQEQVIAACRARGVWPEPAEHRRPATPKPAQRPNGASREAVWEPILPAPADAPEPPAAMLRCDMLHEYFDADDRLLFYVRRREARDDRRKSFVPVVYGLRDGKRGWHEKAPNTPRPLYGLNRLAHADPTATVLLGEGEKSADAAMRLFPDHVAMTWMGGTGADAGADWKVLAGRSVVIWPDADDPGHKAAARIREVLLRLDCDVSVVDTTGLPEKFDAANLELECADPESWLRERLPQPQAKPQPPPPDPFAIEADGLPPAMTAAAFLSAARTPKFLIDPIIQRGFLYTLTARSYHGKTTTLIYLSLCVAMARRFAGLHTEQGHIAYLAGENPDEFAQKLVVACEFWGVDPAELPITVIPGAFDLTSNLDAAHAKAAACGPLSLVVPDTSAAFRYDDDEDDNQQSKRWAQTLRSFTRLPGNPAVVTATHPVKNAERLNLLPRGGSAFLNEVDANLTLWADLEARTAELHWQGKLRGPSFKPIAFELRDHPHPTARHQDGRPIQLAVAVPGEAPAKQKAYGRVQPYAERFYSALLDAIILGGTPGETTLTLWEAECVRRGFIDAFDDGDSPSLRARKRAMLRTAKSDLLAASWIGIDGNRVCDLKR